MKAYRVGDSLFNELSILKEQGFLETTNKKIKISLEELELTKICAPHNHTEITYPTDKKILPITRISLNVSQICNMKCIYCYGRDGEYGEKGLMYRSTAFKAVDFLFKYSDDKSNVSINFFGGEPLLNFPLIKEVVKYSKCLSVKKEKKIHFSISTNGTLFSKNVIEFFNKEKFSVQVSFDGDKEIQDINRPLKKGQSSYDYILPGLKKFLESRNGDAAARVTLTKFDSLGEKVREKLKKIGFKRINITPVTSIITDDFALKESNYHSLFNDLDSICDELIERVKCKKNVNDKILFNLLTTLITRKKTFYSCGAGKGLLAISASGKVFPCHRFVGNDEFILGDVISIKEEKRAPFNYPQIYMSPICANCYARYFCGGNCYHENLETNGDIFIPRLTNCELIKKKIAASIYIYDNLENEERAYLKSLLKIN